MANRLDRYRKTRRVGVVAAMLAFLLQTVAWSLMPVHAAQVKEGWVTLCTTNGIQRIPLSELGVQPLNNAPKSGTSALGNHCDLCVFANGLGTLPTVKTPLVQTHAFVVLRLAHPDQPWSQVSHAPHQPRAPPVSGFV